jgi:hypothetical protein
VAVTYETIGQWVAARDGFGLEILDGRRSEAASRLLDITCYTRATG